jgi:subtilisin family serine protease
MFNSTVRAPGVTTLAASLAQRYAGSVKSTFNLVPGMVVHMSDAQAQALAKDPLVARVEEDGLMRPAVTAGPGLDTPTPGSNASRWGLDRVDQNGLSSPRLDDYYTYCASGQNVRVYILDNGVLPSHPEFANLPNRVDSAPSLTTYLASQGVARQSPCWQLSSGGYTAVASHGTAVASLVGGSTLGIAPSVTLVDVTVGNCYGAPTPFSNYAHGLEWIAIDPNRNGAPAVANISASGLYMSDQSYSMLDNEVNALTDNANVTIVVAAGNACNTCSVGDNVWWYCPAHAARAVTVGGMNQGSDTIWQYSNYGNTTMFYAPAQYVESASTMPNLGVNQLRSQLSDCADGVTYPHDTCTSGTSFATPIVAGLMARILERNPTYHRDDNVWLLRNRSISNGVYIYEPGSNSYTPLVNYHDCP